MARGCRGWLCSPGAVTCLLCTNRRSPALSLLFASTTAPNQMAWEAMAADMVAGGITSMVQQIWAWWKMEKVTFHSEMTPRDKHGGPTNASLNNYQPVVASHGLPSL